jgi:hypothetical protein
MRVPIFDELLLLYGARISLQPHVLCVCLFFWYVGADVEFDYR